MMCQEVCLVLWLNIHIFHILFRICVLSKDNDESGVTVIPCNSITDLKQNLTATTQLLDHCPGCHLHDRLFLQCLTGQSVDKL